MGAIPPRTFARRLQRLDREDVAAFVAVLWATSGWKTRTDGGVVIAPTEESRTTDVFDLRRRETAGNDGDCWTIRSISPG